LAPLPWAKLWLVLLAMALAGLAAFWLKPPLGQASEAPSLESALPRQFGDWREIPQRGVPVSLLAGEVPDLNQPYDQTVMRSYANSRGDVVMLALAWGRNQRQEVKIHRPDLCYVAQGHKVASLRSHLFSGIASPSGTPVMGKQMLTTLGNSAEAVSYWMRIGEVYSEDAAQTRLHILKEGLAGRVPDGVLVRASIRVRDQQAAGAAWPMLDAFLQDMSAAFAQPARQLLIR
jgi:EpsI family protein